MKKCAASPRIQRRVVCIADLSPPPHLWSNVSTWFLFFELIN